MRRLILALILLATPAAAQTEYECYSEGFETDMGGFDDQYTDVGGSVTRTNVGAEVYAGSWALKFVTDAGIYKRASVLIRRPAWHLDRPLYHEFWFKVETGTDDFGVEMAMEVYGAPANEVHLASAVYQEDDPYGVKGWRYWNSGGTWTYFDEDAELTRNVWHHFKWAAHYGDEEYAYAEIDEVPFDISSLAYEKDTAVAAFFFGLSILVWSSDEAAAVEVYVDEVKWGSVGTPCGSAGAL